MNRSQERQLTSTQLNELVYEQWLMAEIQESSLPRLPEGLSNTDICKLEGYFNLQVSICIHDSPVVFILSRLMYDKPVNSLVPRHRVDIHTESQ